MAQHLAIRDIDVVTFAGFGGGGKQRFGKFLAFLHIFGDHHASHRAGALVFAPGRAADVAANNAFKWDYAGFLHQHRASLQIVLEGM